MDLILSENLNFCEFYRFFDSPGAIIGIFGPKIANLGAGAAEINENQSKYVSVSPKTNRYG